MVGLKESGIAQLEAVMLANGKYFYDQSEFGYNDECGTHLCAAGFARLLAVGSEQLEQEATVGKRFANDASPAWRVFSDNCVADGKKLLGIDTPYDQFPEIFDYNHHWPHDLSRGFVSLHDPMDKIKFYINMLRTRANSDGSLTDGPDEARD